MISNQNYDILCFQPSATVHETLISRREKQGLKSLALQGARKTGISTEFQKFHGIPLNFLEFHETSWKFINFKENHVLGCSEAKRSAATIEKALELLVFLHAGAIRWVSCKSNEIH